MGVKFYRYIVYENITYDMFCNSPCWDIASYGYRYLLSKGFHPNRRSFVKDDWEEYLLKF